MIYLDYAATHPLKKKAKDKMLECIDKWENSNSNYSVLEQDIERVRERVKEYIGGGDGVVVFNSGGCEGV